MIQQVAPGYPGTVSVAPLTSSSRVKCCRRLSPCAPARRPHELAHPPRVPTDGPAHLCRLRYFGGEERWGFGFFAYSSEKYELSVFPSGAFFGPPEDAFEVSAQLYLH